MSNRRKFIKEVVEKLIMIPFGVKCDNCNNTEDVYLSKQEARMILAYSYPMLADQIYDLISNERDRKKLQKFLGHENSY